MVKKTKNEAKILKHLAVDPHLAEIIQEVGAYEIKIRKDAFRSLVEAIIYQQLAGSAAAVIYNRFVKIHGRFPEANQLLATPDSALRTAGLSSRKIEYLKDLSSKVADGQLKLSLLREMGDEQVIEHLLQGKGIGRWTAERFLIFCLGREDVLPVGDLGLRKAMQKTYGLRQLPSPEVMHNIAQLWRPYRSIGTWYMWKSLDKFKSIG